MAVAIGLRSSISRRSYEKAEEWQALALPGSEAMRVEDSFLDAQRIRMSEMMRAKGLMKVKSKSTGALRRGGGCNADVFEVCLGAVDRVARQRSQRKRFSSTRGFDMVCKSGINKQSDVESAPEDGAVAPAAVHKPRTPPAPSHTAVALASVEAAMSALDAHAEELLADAMASRKGSPKASDQDKLMQRETQKRTGKSNSRKARHAELELLSSTLRRGAAQEGQSVLRTKSASYIENYRDLLCKGELQDFKYASDQIGRKQIAKLGRAQTAQILGESTDEERIPASQLDCLDLSRSPKGRSGRLLRSSTCEDVSTMESSSTMTSDAPQDEALGDLFATKLHESQVAAQKHKSSRKSKKSKKNKEKSTTPNSLRAMPGHFMDMSGHGEATEDAEVEIIHDAPKPLPNKSPLRRTQSATSIRCPEKPQQLPARPASAPNEDDSSSRRVRCGDSLQCLTAVEDTLRMAFDQDKGVSRPSSAATSRQTIARVADPNLWNIGFDDNSSDPYSVWDCGTEVYNAWGGDDEWGEADWSTEVPVLWD